MSFSWNSVKYRAPRGETVFMHFISHFHRIFRLIYNAVSYYTLHSIKRQVQMNWKGFGRKGLWPNGGTSPESAWNKWGKLRKTSVSIAVVLAEIRTRHVSKSVSVIGAHSVRSYRSYRRRVERPKTDGHIILLEKPQPVWREMSWRRKKKEGRDKGRADEKKDQRGRITMTKAKGQRKRQNIMKLSTRNRQCWSSHVTIF
jgi:hypothetical protein